MLTISHQPKSLSQQNNEEDRLKRKSVAEIDTDTRYHKQIDGSNRVDRWTELDKNSNLFTEK